MIETLIRKSNEVSFLSGNFLARIYVPTGTYVYVRERRYLTYVRTSIYLSTKFLVYVPYIGR